MKKLIALVLAFCLFSSPSFAECNFILNVYNNSGKDIKIKDVKYKIHKSSWETLNFGAPLELKNGKNSYPFDRKIGRWGFSVTNMAYSCHGTKYRFKFTYNCHDDNAGEQTETSQILKLGGDAVEASQTTALANVKDCHGDVVFGESMDDAGLAN